MFAGKLGGVLIVCLVKDRRIDPSKSSDDAIWSSAATLRFGTNGRHTLSPGRGASRYLSDQGCLFLLLRPDRARVSVAGRSAGAAER